MFRLEYKLGKYLNLGGNVGFSRWDGQSAKAYGADLQFEKKISPTLCLALDTEYKRGSNLNAYTASKLVPKELNDYEMQGVYVIPLVRKIIDVDKKIGVEFCIAGVINFVQMSLSDRSFFPIRFCIF